MTRPAARWTRFRGADGPEVLDRPPPPRSGVPVERDPATGRRLPGGPGGRADKQRGAAPGRPWQMPALIAAGVLVVIIAAVAVIAVTADEDGDAGSAIATNGAADPGTGATAGGDPADDGGAAPAETRRVDLEFTVTAVRAAPGFEDRVTVGSSYPSIWFMTGPCDGDGPCTVQHCRAEDACPYEADLSPTGSGYTGQFAFSAFGRPWPECGAVRIAVEVEVAGSGLSGTFTQQHAAPLGYDGDTSVCDFVVFDSSFASV